MEYGGGGSKVSNTVCAYRVVQDIESVLWRKGGIFRFKQSIIVLVAADAAAAEAFTNVVIVVVYLFVQILLFLLLLGFLHVTVQFPYSFLPFFLPLFD